MRVAIATLLLGLLAPVGARADGPYEGQWREGPMRIQVSVESWGGDCGPQPRSTSTDGGSAFRIEQQGDQLTFQLRRARTTRDCWSENRAVRRVSSSYSAGTWRIVCRTPPDDSRGETGTYTIQAVGDDRLNFRDVSRYDWQLNESRCLATITTTQSFTRVGAGTSSPSPSPTPGPAPAPRCTPGAPARVVLRPADAEVPLGGEQCFTARAVDASGCPTRQRVALRVTSGEGRIQGSCFVAPETAGAATVTATAGALSATATLSVRSMDLSDLIARRSETGSLGSGASEIEDPTSQTAARVSARGPEEGVGWLVPAAAVLGALLLVVIAMVLLRRSRASSAPTPPAPTTLSDPGAVTVPDEVPAGEAAGEAAGERKICPTCRRGYPASEARCPHDDTALVPYSEFAKGGGERVCPECGERYPRTVTFCGKDGATLVDR